MRELGYRPNFAGQSLRGGRCHALGIAMFNITSTGNLARLDGFTTAADESGYAITLIKMPDQDESTLAEAAERMLTLPVDGMIFSLNHMVSDFYTFEPPQVLRGDWTPASGYEAGARLAQDPHVTAVYASNDAMAYGCICALRDAGRRVPDDVSIIGVDNNLDTLVPNVPLTSLSFDNRRVGLWAVNRLVGEHAAGTREHVLLPGTLVERDSVRALG